MLKGITHNFTDNFWDVWLYYKKVNHLIKISWLYAVVGTLLIIDFMQWSAPYTPSNLGGNLPMPEASHF